jgi:hypothetical protein
VTNTSGLLEATNGGTLTLHNTITGGNITASGSGGGFNSTVNVEGAISGATLNTLGGGVMQSGASGNPDLNGVTISSGSTYTAGVATRLDGTITNNGTLAIVGTPGFTVLTIGSDVTLSGGGTVTMDSTAAPAYIRGNGVTLTNSDNTIQGFGTVGDSGALAIVNDKTIDATSPAGPST